MKTKAFLFLITFGMIITSCDKYNYIHYTMENKTEDSIKITYSFVKSYFDTQATDTTVFLKENQKDTLFIFEQISPTVYDPEEGEPGSGIPPGIPFADLPDDYKCPVCNAGKEYFKRNY